MEGRAPPEAARGRLERPSEGPRRARPRRTDGAPEGPPGGPPGRPASQEGGLMAVPFTPQEIVEIYWADAGTVVDFDAMTETEAQSLVRVTDFLQQGLPS